MKNEIMGVYDTEKQAKSVVEGLIVQGYLAEEVLVVALDEHITSAFPAGTKVEKIQANHEDSVIDKIKNAIIPDEVSASEGVGNRLLEIGVSDREAPMYATDVENGRILVLTNACTNREVPVVPITSSDEEVLRDDSYRMSEVDSPEKNYSSTRMDEQPEKVQTGSNITTPKERHHISEETIKDRSKADQDTFYSEQKTRDTGMNTVDGAPSFTDEESNEKSKFKKV